MGLIDSHAHLTSTEFVGQVNDVLNRATVAGVEHVICVATSVADARRVSGRANTRVSAAIGIHPHQAGAVTDEDWLEYQRLASDLAVVALGEMGLDYHYDLADRVRQRVVFERQLEIASSRDLPIIIHSREAHDDCVAILTGGGFAGRRVVFHCFTGTPVEAAEIADHGWRLSFTGVVTFKNATQVQMIATGYPMDQLMIETDSPFLSPVPVRHVRPNEPAHLVHVARFLADRREMEFEAFAAQTASNTRAFFGLEAPGVS